jgi:hypothetical protein
MCFAAVLLYGIRFHRDTGDLTETAILKGLNRFRFLFAIEVVLGHTYLYLDNAVLFLPLNQFLFISNGFFFFVSGFGLSHGYHAEASYLKGFLRRRFLYLFLVSLVLFLSFSLISKAGNWTAYPLTLKGYFENTNWFIFEIMVFYLLFYIFYHLKDTKKASILIAVISLLFVNIAYLGGLGEKWYICTLSFPFGLLYREFFAGFEKVLRRKTSVIVCTIMAFVLIICLAAQSEIITLIQWNDFIRNVLFRYLLSFCVIIIFIRVQTHISLENIMSKAINKLSLEIYLLQFPCFYFLSFSMPSCEYFNLLYLTCTFGLLFVSVPIMKFIDDRLHKLCLMA